MNLKDVIIKLKASTYALDNLQVKGRENLDIVLGTIQQLDRSIDFLEKFEQELNASFKIENDTAKDDIAE